MRWGKKMLQAECAVLLGMLVCASPLEAQVRQSGNVTPSHIASWTTTGVIQDGGTATNPVISGLGVLANGPGICQQSGPNTGAYNRICLTSTATSGGFSMTNVGGATGGFTFTLNGVTQGLATVTLPVTTNDAACFADTTGTLKDCGLTPGTVTSVALSMPSIFSVAGSPITSSGTFAVTLQTETANTVFAGPTTGAAATPTFRALVAADLPGSFAGFANPTASVGLVAVNGAAATAMRSDAAPPLSASVQSALTGTANGVAYGTGSFGYSTTAAGGANTVLVGGTPPSFSTATSWFDNAYCNTVGYWIVRFTSVWTCSQGIPANPVWWGADSTGVSDSTSAVNTMLSALGTNCYVQFPPGTFKLITAGTAITQSATCKIAGSGVGVSILSFNHATADGWIITGTQSEFYGFTLTSPVTRTGATFSAFVKADVIRTNIHDLYATAYNQAVRLTQNTTLSKVQNVECRNGVAAATSASSSCVFVGAAGGVNSPDTVLLDNITSADDTPASPQRSCIEIVSGDATTIIKPNCLQAQVGVLIDPGSGDGVLSTKLIGGYFDSMTVAGLYAVSTGTGNIARIYGTNVWFSASGGEAVHLENAGSGTTKGFECEGCQMVIATTLVNVASAAWTDVKFIGGCVAQGTTGFSFPAAVSDYSVVGVGIGTCSGLTGLTTGIVYGGTSSARMLATNNNFNGSTTAITITSPFTGADINLCSNVGYNGAISVGNAAYTITPADCTVQTSVAFTLPRTWTLPSAANFPAGRSIRVIDQIGTLTSSNTLTLARAGSDTVNGGTSLVLNSAFAEVILVSDGSSKWAIKVNSVVAGGTGLTSGTSGGIPYFSSSTTIASSSALGSGLIVTGGGAGAPPATITLGGDCTFSTPNITCTKSNGTSFGTAALQNTGTSGANLPFLNGNNTWSGTNAFGLVGVNASSNSNIALTIGGSVTGTGAFGIYMAGLTLTPGNGNSAYFQYAGGGAIATGGTTVAGAYGALIAPYTKSGGGTITIAYGLYADTQTAGTTNWSLYSAGDASFQTDMYAPNLPTTTGALGAALCWTTTTGRFQRDTNAGGCLVSVGAAKNIVSALRPDDALSKVLALNPVSFRYKPGYGDEGQYEQFGFVAEQVAAVDERMAGRDPDGVLRGVRYMELSAVLAGAVQKLKADNDNLHAEIENLKRRIAR